MRKKQSVIWRGVTEGSWWKVKRSRGVRVPCSAAWRARDSRRGTMTSWKHRPVSSVSSTCWAILWRLWHASTTSSTEKTTPPTPPDQINETLIQGFIGNVTWTHLSGQITRVCRTQDLQEDGRGHLDDGRSRGHGGQSRQTPPPHCMMGRRLRSYSVVASVRRLWLEGRKRFSYTRETSADIKTDKN